MIADNFAAHSLGGFVESFFVSYVCRVFFIGHRSQFQELDVRTDAFPCRTKQQRQLDIAAAAAASDIPSHGVKRQCAITQRLDHFYVTTGYAPDVMHNILEGIVLVELALCLDILIKKVLIS